MSPLKNYLDALVEKFNSQEFIAHDPVQFPLLFTQKADIEIAALLSSTIAWGNRTQIVKNCRRMLFTIMAGKPYAYVISGEWRNIVEAENIHRTFFGRDLIYFCRGLQAIYANGGTMEDLFKGMQSVWDGMENLRQTFFRANGGAYCKHVPNPQKSACKRLCMMLRWLVRSDGIVDLGIWHAIDPAMLMMPLDVHSARTARELGLLERKSNDRTAVELLTHKLREFCPQDPVKYDYALFGAGIAGIHPAAA
jgi:uncharacterized protein (TIGR02757 family)